MVIDLTQILQPVDQVNLGGLWNEVPPVADQADLLDEGVSTHDGDAGYIWTVISGRYCTLQMPNIDLTEPGFSADTPLKYVKLAFVGRLEDVNTIPTVRFRLFISGVQATPALDVDFTTFGAPISPWGAREGVTLGPNLLPPWTNLTCGEYNDENDAGPPGCRMQLISVWGAPDTGTGKPYEPPAHPVGP